MIESAGCCLVRVQRGEQPRAAGAEDQDVRVEGFGLPEPLRGEDDGDEGEADGVEERLRVDEKEAGNDEQRALPQRAALPEPALEAARDRDDADRGGEGDQSDRAPVRLAKGLEAAGEEQPGAARIEHEHERHEERRASCISSTAASSCTDRRR